MQKGKSFKLSEDFLNQLKSSVNLVDVVGEVVVLRKSGANHMGLCPFHSERSPSFTVSESKQFYHCYGCKAGGDVIKFVRELHGLGFVEAIEELSERAGLKLPQNFAGAEENEDPELARRRQAARERLALGWKLNRFALQFFQSELQKRDHLQVQKYFKSRGVHGDIAREFYVGAAPNRWDSLARRLVEAKAPIGLAVDLGLIRASKKEVKAVEGAVGYFDLFRNRAMFPIIDQRGKVVGFGGRLMPGAPEPGPGEVQSPKYINSAASFIYQKEKVVFGLFQAAKHIRERGEVILVEGYFDVLALHAAGFQNAVATCGTALTLEHLKQFQRLAPKVTVLFDNDRGGVQGTELAMELGLDQGLVLHGATLPPKLDPDEFLFQPETGALLPEGVERLKAILAASRPLIDSRFEDQFRTARAGGPEAISQAVKRIGAWMARFKDPVGRAIRIQQAARELGVAEALLYQAAGIQPPAGGAVQGSAGMGREGAAVRSERDRPNPVSSSAPTFRESFGLPPKSTFSGKGDWRPGGDRKGSWTPKDRYPRQGAATPEAPVRRPKRGAELSPREKILLGALARGGDYSAALAETRSLLGPGVSMVELFDYEPARAFVGQLFGDAGALQRFREAPELFLGEGQDAQVRTTLMEALLSQHAAPELVEVKEAGRQSARWALERISQRIMKALGLAEASKDAELEAKLKKEYLDCQRRIKEFSTFYDEA
jgi:DNA primase